MNINDEAEALAHAAASQGLGKNLSFKLGEEFHERADEVVERARGILAADGNPHVKLTVESSNSVQIAT